MAYCTEFFPWYNNHHYHSGLAMLTPASVHYGTAEAIVANRGVTLQAAYAAHPERFVRGSPQHQAVPKDVSINPPDVPDKPHQQTPNTR